VNKIHIPIRSVHLETVFERSDRTTYALLEPTGDVTPLRVKLSDFRQKLGDRFSDELPDDEVARRLSQPSDLELVVIVHLERSSVGQWEIQVRLRAQAAKGSVTEARLQESRKSPRRVPDQRTDIKVELGPSTLEGTIYNVSEHGLGVALFTTQLQHLQTFKVDQEVEVVDTDNAERLRGKIRSQYPADGGCVLGIELRDRFQLKNEA
jgi:PilZ domain